MKFLISQGQAIRSVFGRSRVTHFMAAPLDAVCLQSVGLRHRCAVSTPTPAVETVVRLRARTARPSLFGPLGPASILEGVTFLLGGRETGCERCRRASVPS